jgi:hypothetical protein
MEKIEKYQAIILNFLQQYESEHKDGETYVLTDTIHHHYQIMRAGWDNLNHYFLRVRIHLHIKPDGKIWIMENRTEDEIAEILVDLGVDKKDIVLALLPEHVRELSGYGV